MHRPLSSVSYIKKFLNFTLKRYRIYTFFPIGCLFLRFKYSKVDRHWWKGNAK